MTATHPAATTATTTPTAPTTPGRGMTMSDLVARHARVTPDEVVIVDGIRVTSPARTVIDVARTLPFEQAVAVADAALHGEILTADELEAALRRAGGARGLPAARRVVAFADGAADGPGESISRVRLARAGLPRPELQHVVRVATGRFIAQVDFWWPDVVYREKRREDAVRATGAPVVRWDWRDLDEFSDVITRLAVLLVP